MRCGAVLTLVGMQTVPDGGAIAEEARIYRAGVALKEFHMAGTLKVLRSAGQSRLVL
jgi:hypothetical protein